MGQGKSIGITRSPVLGRGTEHVTTLCLLLTFPSATPASTKNCCQTSKPSALFFYANSTETSLITAGTKPGIFDLKFYHYSFSWSCSYS